MSSSPSILRPMLSTTSSSETNGLPAITVHKHALPVMTQEEFNKLLTISISNDISQHLKGKDLSQVLPDVGALAKAFIEVPYQRRVKIWDIIGATYIKALFATDKKWMSSLDAAGLFINLVNIKFLLVDEGIKTTNDFVKLLTFFRVESKTWTFFQAQIFYWKRYFIQLFGRI